MSCGPHRQIELTKALLGGITSASLSGESRPLLTSRRLILLSNLEPKIKSKRWTPESEAELLETWAKEDTYEFNMDSGKKIYTVDTPPPYLSGPMHVGQVTHYTQIDAIARYRRMQGFEVNFPLGIDRNGLPVEIRVEKDLGISMHRTPRDEFLHLCKKRLDDDEKIAIRAFKRLGIAFNTYEDRGSYRTDSPRFRAVTQATFIEIWNKGLVYSDVRPNNWCFECGTTIADAEVEYSERQTTLNYLHFEVEGLDPIEIATTRPELLCACGAVFVHPDDARYSAYHGKKARVPIFNIEVPIIASSAAQMEFATGALMVCSYGDQADVMAFRDHALTPIAAVTPEGTMTEAAGKYAGMTMADARKAILADLKKKKLLIRQEQTMQRIPLCWRSGTPIEFIAMNEYYVKQVEFVEDLLKIAREMTFYPPFHRQILIDWLNRVTVDWPVSRRRYYGTEIPIWYCKSCGAAVLPELTGEPKYYQPWRENPPFSKCPKCGVEEGFRGEERTFDTWMDSSTTGLQIIGFMRNEKLFKKAFGNVLRPQGKDIVRTWLYYSLLRTLQLTGKPAFKEAWISGHVVDENGETMSKSKGNSPPPMPFVEKYGADAMRMFGILEAGLGSDVRFSEDRLAGVSKFMTKLWNIARFISMFPIPKEMGFKKLTSVDQWILAELNKVLERIVPECDLLDFHKPATEVRGFTWNFFADIVMEMIKGRALNTNGTFSADEQKSAWSTLHEVLKKVTRALAPITPFITDRIYRELYDERGVHRQSYPLVRKDWESDLTEHTVLLLQTNQALWKFKRENGISLRQGLPEAYIPENLRPWSKDLQAMHGIERISFGQPNDAKFVEVKFLEVEGAIYIRPPAENKT
ncbi:MAG: valine--tRNA ligase [Candidatus Thorarchaeota archaeon]|nr:MAG: valine--tRNA ligase [Candidatus Thorarchaeota archaeon]